MACRVDDHVGVIGSQITAVRRTHLFPFGMVFVCGKVHRLESAPWALVTAGLPGHVIIAMYAHFS